MPRQYKTFISHFIFWSAYIILNYIVVRLQDINYDTFSPFYLTFVRYLTAILFFYFLIFFIFPRCLNSKSNYSLIVVYLPISILINFYIRIYTFGTLVPYFAGTPSPGEAPIEYFIYSLNWWVQFTLFGLGYWFYKKSLNIEKEKRAKEKDNYELQQQKLIAECNFLRTQINPHFLYNTLNFFISKTAVYDEKLSDGLTKLASIMRYSLTQANSNGQVLLQDEVTNMENFIALQQLRYGNTLHMEYTKTGNITTQSILPHLLITLVENAFKHGNTRSNTQPLIISLVLENNALQFTVTNAIDKVTLEQSGTNVGLQNFKDRLHIAYNSNCTYTVDTSNGIYKAYLQLLLLVNDATATINTISDLLPHTNGIVTTDGQLKYIPIS
jgi:two-component system, LytTR family, sensor kinase